MCLHDFLKLFHFPRKLKSLESKKEKTDIKRIFVKEHRFNLKSLCSIKFKVVEWNSCS